MNMYSYPRINRNRLAHNTGIFHEYQPCKFRMLTPYARINCSQSSLLCHVATSIQRSTSRLYHLKVFSFHLLSPDFCGLNEKLNLHCSFAYIKSKSSKPPKYSVDSYGLKSTTETVNQTKSQRICIFTADENSNTEQKKLLNAYWTTPLAEGDPLYSTCFLDENSYYKFTPRPSIATLDKHCLTQRSKTWGPQRYIAFPNFMLVAKPALDVTVKQCLSSVACQPLATGAALLANLTWGVRLAFPLWATKTRLCSRLGVNFDDCCTQTIKTRPRAICSGANNPLKSNGSTCLAYTATGRRSIEQLSSSVTQ